MNRCSLPLFAALFVVGLCVPPGFAQAPRAPLKQWWAYRPAAAVYTPPNRPIWKLADIKRRHAGQDNWQELVVSNPEQQGTYHSAAPGTKFDARMNTDTKVIFAVVAGEMHFTVEGQPPVIATRGSVVNILESTLHSWEIAGSENALWVEVHPTNTKTLYPAEGAPPPARAGSKVIKVALNNAPGVYAAPNQLYWNFFEAVAACAPLGVRINEDHQIVSARAAYATANDPDNKCNGRGGPATITAARPAFDPKAPFGHMHDGKTEWFVVLSGTIAARLEAGELRGSPGDVLSAPAGTWHDIGFEGAGLSAMLAFIPYNFSNLTPVSAD